MKVLQPMGEGYKERCKNQNMFQAQGQIAGKEKGKAKWSNGRGKEEGIQGIELISKATRSTNRAINSKGPPLQSEDRTYTCTHHGQANILRPLPRYCNISTCDDSRKNGWNKQQRDEIYTLMAFGYCAMCISILYFCTRYDKNTCIPYL